MNANTAKAIARREATIELHREMIEHYKATMTTDAARTYLITESLDAIGAAQIDIARLHQNA